MNNKNSVVKAGIGYTIGNYLLKGLSFLTIPIFVRLMTKDDYGLYNTYISYEAMLYVVLGLALHSSLKNAKYKFESRFSQYVLNCVYIQLISFVFWIVLSHLLYPVYGSRIGFNYLEILLLVIYSFATSLIQIFNAYVGLYYQYTDFLKISSFNAVANIILSVVLITTVFPNRAYQGRILGTVIPTTIIGIYIIIYFIKRSDSRKIVNDYIRYGIKYSIPIVPHGLSQVILSSFDRIMINYMVGSAEAGVYSFAYNIYSIVFVTTSSLDQVWGPWFYEKMNSGEYHLIRKYSNYYICFISGLIISIILGSPEIVLLLGSSKYSDSVYAVIPVVASGFFTFLYTLPVQVEYYYEKTGYIAVGTSCAAIINIVLNYIFISKYGYVAAAYTTIVTYILYFIFHLVLSIKIQNKCIFSLKSFIFSTGAVFLVSIISIILIDHIIARWTILIILSAGVILFVQKKIGIKNIFKLIKK